MNALCYKIVFSKRLGALVAVGEHTSGQGKAAGTGVRNAAYPSSAVGATAGEFVGSLKAVFASVALTCFTATTIAAGPAANTLPTGYSVNNGNVAVSTSGTNMTIKQTTDKASVNWQSFSIGSAASVNIQQNSASSVLLNRVVGNDPSQVFGKLTANGQVILINPNGIVFGKGGSVTASTFTASTFGLSDQDFAKGKYNYTRNGSTAGVTVEDGATISTTASAGYVALIGASVDNQGTISTKQGAVVLAAGESVALPTAMTDNISVPLSGKVRLELQPSTINAMVSNSGSITTEGGQVLMQAAALSDAVASVTHTGTIETTGTQGGAVTLQADHGNIKVAGSIKANSTGKDERGLQRKGGDIIIGRDEQTGVLANKTDVTKANLESTGGFVETSANYLDFGGVDVKAGHWLLDPYNITIGSSEATSISTALNTTALVTVTTAASGLGSTGAGDGNITVSSNILKSSGNTSTLELLADNGITINGGVSIKGTSTSGGLNVKLVSKGTTTNTNISKNSRGISLFGSINTNGTVVIDSTTKLTGGTQHTGGSALWISSGSVLRGTDVNVTLNVDPTSPNRVYGLFAQNNTTIEATAGDVYISSTLKNSQPYAGWYAQSLLLGSSTGPVASIKATGNITLKSDTSAVTNNVNTGGIGLVDARLQAGGNISVESIVGNNGMNAIGVGNGGSGLGFSAISTGTNGTISFKSNQGTIGLNNLISPTPGVAGLSAKDITIDNGTGAAAGLTGVRISGAGGVSATNSLTINAAGAGTALDNSAHVSNATLATYSLTGSGTQSGVISGAGALNKTGTGNLTLSGENTHSGTTTVTAGTLTLGNVNALQNSTLDTGTSGTQQVAFSATGNTYNIGSLQGVADLAIGANTISVGANEATNTTKTYSGAITGTGGLTKAGLGTQILSGNNSYTGTTTVNGGTLQVGDGGTTGKLGSGAVINNAKLAFVRSVDTSIDNVITGTGNVSANITTNADRAGALTVNSSNFSVGGTIDLRADGDVNLNNSITTTNNTGDAVKLVAGQAYGVTGGVGAINTSLGNVKVTSGKTITVGSGGVAALYSGSIAGTTGVGTLGSMAESGSGKFRYNSDETTSNYTKGLSQRDGTSNNGVNIIYREAPTVEVTAYSVASGNLTYNGSTQKGTQSYSDNSTTTGVLKNSDASAGLTGTAVYAYNNSGVPDPKNAGTYKVTASGLSSNVGYSLSYITGSLVIDKAKLQEINASKTYDGLSTVTGSQLTSIKGIGTETFTAATTDSATISGKDVVTANNKVTNTSGLNLTGNVGTTLASNYDLNATPVASAVTITPKSLTAIYSANNKVFDGNTNAIVAGVLKDAIAGDSVTPNHTSATFDSVDVGTNKTVTVSGLSLSGKDATNYKLDPVVNTGNKATTKANITAVVPTPPAPSIPKNNASIVKIPTGSSNPFALASAEDLTDETCSANNIESCQCEESSASEGVSICYQPKAGEAAVIR